MDFSFILKKNRGNSSGIIINFLSFNFFVNLCIDFSIPYLWNIICFKSLTFILFVVINIISVFQLPKFLSLNIFK